MGFKYRTWTRPVVLIQLSVRAGISREGQGEDRNTFREEFKGAVGDEGNDGHLELLPHVEGT
jgi:hypothetical protein